MRGVGRKIVLVDKNAARAEAEANDLLHAVPFAHPFNIRAGDYVDLAGSQAVIIAAGANQKPGETRLHLGAASRCARGRRTARPLPRAVGASGAALREPCALAQRVGMVCRTLTWHRVVTSLEEPFRSENANPVPGWLGEFFEVMTQ